MMYIGKFLEIIMDVFEKKNYNGIKKIIVIQCLLLAVVAGYIFMNPVAFLKSNTIRPASLQQMITLNNQQGVDIAPLVAKIPYKGGLIYTVEPQQRFNEMMRNGSGNCSNKSYGLAYYLGQRNINYNIVHLLIPDKFLDGKGHVVVNTTYYLSGKLYDGIVDMTEGGLPSYDRKYVDINDMLNGNIDQTDFQIATLNQKVNNRSKYYGDFLTEAVIGITPASEVNAHFALIKAIYMPLGSKKIEKFIYDGLALIAGIHPSIYVLPNEFARLYAHSGLRRWLNIFALWMVRILFVGLTVAISWYIVLTMKPFSKSANQYAGIDFTKPASSKI